MRNHENAQAHLISDLRRNSGYLARQEIEDLIKKCSSNPKRLEPFGFKIYSQGDEDGILIEIFSRLGIHNGTFCEIGVENGLECNTLALIHQGWRGVWLEGNPKQQKLIENKFFSLLKNKRLALGVGMVKPNNINLIIQEMFRRINCEVDDIDFLSIDIDGMDIYLLEAISSRPKVICIEYNAKFPPTIYKKPVFSDSYEWTGLDYMGSSLLALTKSAAQIEYSLVATNLTGANAFFVRNDLLGDSFANDLSIQSLYNPPRYYLIFDHFMYNVGHRPDFGEYTDLI